MFHSQLHSRTTLLRRDGQRFLYESYTGIKILGRSPIVVPRVTENTIVIARDSHLV